MKKLFASFFFVLLFLISVNHLLIFTWYFANKAAITEKFCVNKNKPELQCNGKCHLNEVLASANERESSSSNFVLSSEIFIPHFYQESSNTINLVEFVFSHFPHFTDLRTSQFAACIFHPPPNGFYS